MKASLFLAGVLQLFGACATARDHERTGFVRTGDGVRLKYTQNGPRRGQELLFIPGWRQTAAEWQKQVDHFADAGFRVTTYDMRGHGDSEKPSFGYRISRFAADLNDVLEELRLRDVTVVGHSMGSSIAWAWWDQYPGAHDRIRSLVVADQPAAMVRDPHWTDEQAAALSAIFTPDLVYDIANDMAGQLLGLLQGMFTDSVSQSDFDWVVAQNLKMSDANAAALLVDHAFRDWRDVLPRIDVPALVLAGNVSTFPPHGIEWVASQIPGAESYTFTSEEKGSHFVFWENPERFNAVLEDFLVRNV